MHMKKKSLPILLALGLLCPSAARAEQGVLLEQQSGQSVGYAFSSNPKITFTATDLVIEATDVKVSYALEGLKVKFGDATSAIRDIDAANVKFRLSGSQVSATGLAKGQTVTVHSAGGQLLGTAKASANGEAILSLQHLKPGLYIIHSGKTTYKFTKK